MLPISLTIVCLVLLVDFRELGIKTFCSCENSECNAFNSVIGFVRSLSTAFVRQFIIFVRRYVDKHVFKRKEYKKSAREKTRSDLTVWVTGCNGTGGGEGRGADPQKTVNIKSWLIAPTMSVSCCCLY